MDLTGDDLAGIIDLFGALTPTELDRAIEELAFKHGVDPPDPPIAAALADYRLVELERRADAPLLVPGPTALPTLLPGVEDLPHVLAVEPRDPDPAALGAAAEERFRADAARAIAAENERAIERLLDASYDFESWQWGALDLGDARDRLDAASRSNGKNGTK